MPADRNILDVADFNHLAYRDNPHYEALRKAMDDFARSAGLGGGQLREVFREIDNSRYFGHNCACGRMMFPVKGKVEDNGTWLHALYVCPDCGTRDTVGMDVDIMFMF